MRATCSLALLLSLPAAVSLAQPVRELPEEEDEQETMDEIPVELANPLAVVHFPSGSSRVSDDVEPELEEAADWLEDNPQRLIIIEGHADRVGSRAANLRLSQARADAVRLELLRAGADPLRIVSAGYSEDEPLNTRDRSRRVVIRGTTDTYPDLVEAQMRRDEPRLEPLAPRPLPAEPPPREQPPREETPRPEEYPST